MKADNVSVPKITVVVRHGIVTEFMRTPLLSMPRAKEWQNGMSI